MRRSRTAADGGGAGRGRGFLPRPRLAALALLGACLTAGPAEAGPPCPAPPGFEASRRVASADVTVLFRTVPTAIEVGRHFTVEAVVCTGPPAAPLPTLRVDAQMPEHRHGMNYRPRVTKGPAGVYVAEGLLFHMPGHWQLLFDVDDGGRTQRLSTDLVVE